VGAGLGLDVGQVRLPAVGFVAAVVHRGATGQGHRSGPQRVVGCRHQDLVARLHRHHDQFADAVAENDVIDLDVGDALQLTPLHDRLASGEDAL